MSLRGGLLVALLLALPAVPAAAQRIRVEERIEDLEARARSDSTDPAALYNLAVGYMSRRRWERVDSLLHRAVSLDPQFAAAYFALALSQNRNERYWEQLRRRGGDTAVAAERYRRLGFERRAMLIDPFLDVRLLGGFSRWMSRGSEELAEGNYERAYQRFDEMLTGWLRGNRDSASSRLLYLHSLAAARAARLPDAIADVELLLRRSLEREASDSTQAAPLLTNEWRYLLAALLHRAGQRDRALELYREAAVNDLGNYMAHVQLARLHESAGAWSAAVAERRLAADINPDDHTMYLDLGVTLARATQWAAAESALVRAAELQPLDARVAYRLGVVQQQLGSHDAARRSLERFLELAPSRFAAAAADARQRLAALPR